MGKKNLVFMMDIDIKGDGRYASSRTSAYKYSISSWKKWCDKNNSELFVLSYYWIIVRWGFVGRDIIYLIYWMLMK